MKNNALAYSLKVWLTAVFLGSIMLSVFIGHSTSSKTEVLTDQAVPIFAVSLLYSIIFSLPSLLILLLSSLGLCNISITNIQRKLILTTVGIVSCLLAFFLFDQYSIKLSDLGFVLPYLGISIAGIWFYKLKTDKDEVETLVRS